MKVKKSEVDSIIYIAIDSGKTMLGITKKEKRMPIL